MPQASKIAPSVPSPLLASYLRSGGSSRPLIEAQPGSRPSHQETPRPQRISLDKARLRLHPLEAELQASCKLPLLLNSNLSHPADSTFEASAESLEQIQTSEPQIAPTPRGVSELNPRRQRPTYPNPNLNWDEQRHRTSLDLKSWATEQKKKRQLLPGEAISGIRASLEIQGGRRQRSLDLVRADVKNVRLSFDSASVPKDEPLRCNIAVRTST